MPCDIARNRGTRYDASHDRSTAVPCSSAPAPASRSPAAAAQARPGRGATAAGTGQGRAADRRGARGQIGVTAPLRPAPIPSSPSPAATCRASKGSLHRRHHPRLSRRLRARSAGAGQCRHARGLRRLSAELGPARARPQYRPSPRAQPATWLARHRAALPIPRDASGWQPGDIFTSLVERSQHAYRPGLGPARAERLADHPQYRRPARARRTGSATGRSPGDTAGASSEALARGAGDPLRCKAPAWSPAIPAPR